MNAHTQLPYIIEVLPYYLGLWSLYLGPVLIVSGSICFISRCRVTWNWVDFTITFIPYWFWVALNIGDGGGKTLSNAVVEPLLLGCIAISPATLKSVIGNRISGKLWSVALIMIVNITAYLLWKLIPALPE